jgi:hypothetical protein
MPAMYLVNIKAKAGIKEIVALVEGSHELGKFW